MHRGTGVEYRMTNEQLRAWLWTDAETEYGPRWRAMPTPPPDRVFLFDCRPAATWFPVTLGLCPLVPDE